MRASIGSARALLALLPLAMAIAGCDSGTSPDDSTGSGGSHSTGGTGGGIGGGGSGGTPEECRPKTCQDAGAECGWIFDGCGEILDCGGCFGGATCGLTAPNRCEICQPKACSEFDIAGHAACGAHAGGCDATIDCGGCGPGEVCGDGKHNVCVSSRQAPEESEIHCMDRDQACAAADIECGFASDGCGGLVDCGGCTGGDTCGGGRIPGKCGQAPTCVPRSCEDLGFNCGLAIDNCGNQIDCGPLDCGPRMVCGGGGANKCGAGGSGNVGDQCPDGVVTTVSGTVRTPKGASGDPLYGALVYIPKSDDDIPPLDSGVSCDRCEDQVPPTAIAHAITGPDGTFTLVEVPSGTQPLVIQLGKWRRKIDVNLRACEDNVLTGDQTRLPRRHNEDGPFDNIPKIAISTGSVDALECVFRKMGVEDRVFSDPTGSGRIHFYRGTRNAGAKYSNNTPAESVLLGDADRMKTYDAILFACNGNETATRRAEADVARLVEYADGGGRIFATHFSRDLLRYYEPFASSAVWSTDSGGFDQVLGRLDESFPKGRDFATWLRNVDALWNDPGAVGSEIVIKEGRKSVSSVNQAQAWITLARDGGSVEHMTFNTPMGVPAEDQCGRVVFSDFHVTVGNSGGTTFPNECGNGNLEPQEKVLEFMLFDLAACIQDDDPPPPTCTPHSCEDVGFECGRTGDGCGGVLECGTCPAGLVCGGAGVRGKCAPPCVPRTCAELGQQCGRSGDGCGGTIDCGACPPGQLCGVGGPNLCGTPACNPKTCAQLGVSCGPASNGCGGVLDCGCCPGDCPGDPQ